MGGCGKANMHLELTNKGFCGSMDTYVESLTHPSIPSHFFAVNGHLGLIGMISNFMDENSNDLYLQGRKTYLSLFFNKSNKLILLIF